MATPANTSAEMDSFQKLYLDAAKIEGKPGIYFVGPFGNRVSFASQQRRALNTVWALEHAGKIREGQDVAVVGGGLAGLTAATALAARKCSVWLYESRPRVLNIQSRTMHRYVHPTVNFWPEKDLDATTQFPFMDWYADICAPILQRVGKEWADFFAKHLSKVYTSTQATGVEINAGIRSDKVKLITTGEGPTDELYDAVLFTSGFGTETVIKGAEGASYWEEDFLPEQCAKRKILISGTGDGGLIDVLRCVHRDFKLGQLPVELVKMLDETAMKAKIKDLESGVVEQAGKNDEEKAATLYGQEYPALIDKLNGNCRRFLDQSLIKRDPPIRLVGKLPTPYAFNAAPVHKLMIAHAIAAGAVTYEQGVLTDGPVFTPQGKSEEVLVDTLCVARHGAEPPLAGILDNAQINQLRANQRLLADLLEARPYDDKHWANWQEYPARDVKSVEFARFRLPLASSYMMNDYNLRVALGLSKDVPVYVIGIDSLGTTSTGALPTSLFGVPTDHRPVKVIDAYAD